MLSKNLSLFHITFKLWLDNPVFQDYITLRIKVAWKMLEVSVSLQLF